MKLGSRIFLCCLAIVCLCLYYPLDRLANAVAVHYREGVEDTLADQANVLASVVEESVHQGRFSADDWQHIFDHTHSRSLQAHIYKLKKNRVDSGVYITDHKGIVLFDSENPDNVGKDFSKWRDVYLTLRGEYGARTTRKDDHNDASSILHVAAPIRHADGSMAGVLTVSKPTTNIRYFEAGARRNIQQSGILSLMAAGILSLLVTVWLTRPIKRLTLYARGIRDGHTPPFPKLDTSEIGELGHALAEMQETLEGRRYVEQYVEHLTHELKSPLSAIRGAAELLGEGAESMEPERRKRFITNIESQSRRIQEIVDRMLELAALENRSYQRSTENIHLPALIEAVCADKEPCLEGHNLHVQLDLPSQCIVRGDRFLLQQALSNLIQNAMDFSPQGSEVRITLDIAEKTVCCVVCDEGPGIPDYAEQRVFEKFFSLQRPGTNQKSTGLGLNFVVQIARLHDGTISLSNRKEGGCMARLTLPCV